MEHVRILTVTGSFMFVTSTLRFYDLYGGERDFHWIA